MVKEEPAEEPLESYKMESRSRASPEQFAALVEFMESHGDITRPPQQGPQGRIKADRLWQELAELLNSICGGVIKPLDKWRKVWADWKTKTKKKALAIRCEASGTGAGPSSRQTLTVTEERVLGIMGLTAIIGQAAIEGPPSEKNSLLPPTRDFVKTVCPSLSAKDENILVFIPSHSIQATTASTAPLSLRPPSGEHPRHSPPAVLTPQPDAASAPTAATSRRLTSPSPGTPTPRRRGLLRARTRRRQTPFERATSEFVAVEQCRLELEADREKNYHEREMERLRLESRRIEIEEKRNLILSRLAGSIDNLLEILPQLRQTSLPSTDIIP